MFVYKMNAVIYIYIPQGCYPMRNKRSTAHVAPAVLRLEKTNRKVKEKNNRKENNNRLTAETKRKRSSFFFQ